MSGEKRSYSFLKTFFLCCCLVAVMALALGRVSSTQAAPSDDLIITGVIDGPLSGGTPKAVELYVVNDIPDLSIYGIGTPNNGNPSTGAEFTFPNDSATAGSFIYVASESTQFTAFFGFAPDYTNGSALSINGDDVVELYTNNVVTDVFGVVGQDGTGQAWEYLDGWAYRVNATGPDGSTFVLSNWSFSGPNALDGESTNSTASTPFPIGTYQNGAVGPTPTPSPSEPQLLLTELVVTPTGGEFVEIYNPTGSAVDLSDVYLTDGTFAGGSTYYYNIVTGSNAGGGGFDDFHARFPDGATIAAGEYQTVALAGATAFFTEFGVNPTYELIATDASVDDMREATTGSIDGQGGLSNSGEVVVLYYWDGTTDLVTDLDYVVWGDKAEGVDKTGVSTDGPDADSDATAYLDDTAIASQDVVSTGAHPNGSSWQREDLTEGTETKSGGNGADGHDETSENLSTTWCESDTITPNAASVCPTTPPPSGALKIHEVQGSGSAVTNPGSTVTVEAIVVGVFNDLNGFFIQEEDVDVDADPTTSEGIFVYCGTCTVAVGDKVEVTGLAEEFYDMSQIDTTSSGSINVLSSNNTLPTPATISLPISLSAASVSAAETELNAFYEPYEGMLVTFTGDLTVAEYFELARYGQVVLSDGRIEQFTNANTPSAAGYTQHQIDKMAKTIILDDLNNLQNAPLDFGNPANDTPVFHPVPGFSVSNYFRGGDTITNLTGVLHWSFAGQSGTDAWRIRPVTESYSYDFTTANPRPSVPNVGGDVKVASFNVLNYFNGDGNGGGFPTSRGADSSAEFDRQTDKIVAAIIEMDADIIGLMEIENDFADGANSAIADLVDALNAVAGSGTYAYADPGGNVGTDEIAVGIIYKPGTVTLAGSVATLTDAGFTPSKNRPAMAATFDSVVYGERFTVVVNHLKSKGSGCGAGDDDTTTGQGNCNGTRTSAADYMVNTWLPTDPTNSGDPDFLIIGDLNSYAMEEPITTIKDASYTDLLDSFSGGNAYGYVFDGEVGYLDHALSSSSLTPQINDAAIWNINADEVNLLDYNDGIKDSGEQTYERKPTATTLYAPDPFRSSDHDPVLVGINLTTNTAISLTSAEAGGVINSGIILLMVTLLTLATLFMVARRGRQTQA